METENNLRCLSFMNDFNLGLQNEKISFEIENIN